MKPSWGCWLTLAALMLGACGGTQEPSTTGATGTQATGTQATQPGAASQEVQVFFGVDGSSECDEVESYPRLIAADSDPIRGVFDALLAGPLPAETGAASWFSADTAGAVLSTDLADGVLTVDLADLSGVIPNASSSCGSSALLSQLRATAFQFEEVEMVTFLFEGSCDRFFEFLQMECTPAIR
jgi:spore germination protein GerM